MIKVRCSTCSNLMSVDENKKGMLVRCPQCKSINKIPDNEKNTLVRSNAALDGCSEQMKKLYSAVMEADDDNVVSSQVIGEDSNKGLLFVIKTGEDNTRTQMVCAFATKSPIGQDHVLCVFSHICDVDDFDVNYELLLKHLDPALMHLQMQDNTLQLYGAFPFDDCKYDSKANFIYLVAAKADAIEEAITDADNH